VDGQEEVAQRRPGGQLVFHDDGARVRKARGQLEGVDRAVRVGLEEGAARAVAGYVRARMPVLARGEAQVHVAAGTRGEAFGHKPREQQGGLGHADDERGAGAGRQEGRGEAGYPAKGGGVER
jgi:hypothetical protein